MSTLAYEIVDVFTDRPFAGNPLAVVYGGDDLAGDHMQALAREFNLSETVFALPPTQPGATYRARIFTPESELPFAGHPSVGIAVSLMRRGDFPAGPVVQECGAGLLSIEVHAAGSATLTGGAPTLGEPLDAAPLLAMAGLAGDELAAPRSAGCGLSWTFLPVRREQLAEIQIDTAAARRLAVTDICVFSWSPATREAHSRVFVPGSAVPEDPATGSAALGLGVYLVATGWLPPSAVSSYRIHQGHEMGRPSLLECTVTATEGRAVAATVAGHVCPIARGEITVPPFVG